MSETHATLGPRLVRLIEAHGPLSMAQFMALALGEPHEGVYATPAIGQAGHFTTAPEISQIFGELVGLALVQVWLDQGSPTPFLLVEAGPGRGTLMADLLRAARTVPAFLAAAELHLIETSQPLRELQAQTLQHLAPEGRLHFHVDIATLPETGPVFLVANEFLDALPIHQYVRAGQDWYERRVGLDEAGQLIFVRGQAVPPPSSHAQQDFVETAPAREAWVQQLAARLAGRPGLGLLIDYGDIELVGETLQALSHHRSVEPLTQPGSADLSSHVAFGALADAARRQGCAAHGPISQAAFLDRLGGRARLARLQAARPASAKDLAAGYERLTEADQMGVLFKVMAITDRLASPPPGFGAADMPSKEENP